MILEYDCILVINSDVSDFHEDGTKTKLFDYKKGDWCLRKFEDKELRQIEITKDRNGYRTKILFMYAGNYDYALEEMVNLVDYFEKWIVNFI